MNDNDGKKNDAPETLLLAVARVDIPADAPTECEACRSASSGATSNAYRAGWDAIFGKKEVGQA